MGHKVEANILEGKVFLLIFFFSFAGVVMYYFRVFYLIYVYDQVGYSIFSMILSAYSFLLIPVLMFIAFYYICGRGFPERPASVIISLVAGSLVGTWIGGLVTSGILAEIRDFDFVFGLAYLSSQLEFGVVRDVLFALAAVASAWLVRKWDEMLSQVKSELKLERPFTIILASIIYIAFGILTLCVAPILALLPLISGRTLIEVSLAASFVLLVVINGLSQIVIGYGLYQGRRGGWILAFIVSLIGVAVNVNSLTCFIIKPLPSEILDLALITVTVISFALNLILLGLLLPLISRRYCRIINPQTSKESMS